MLGFEEARFKLVVQTLTFDQVGGRCDADAHADAVENGEHDKMIHCYIVVLLSWLVGFISIFCKIVAYKKMGLYGTWT